MFYDGIESFDAVGKLHLSRVIEAGREALPPYLAHLQRWWQWLERFPAVMGDTRVPLIAHLMAIGPDAALASADPVQLLPIEWKEVIASPPADLTAHQLHNVLHQFSLEGLRDFDEAGGLPLALRMTAFGGGVQQSNTSLDRVTPRSISIELRSLGIHSSYAELTERGWYFHFAETNAWGIGKNARLNVLDALLRWMARGTPRLRPSSYLDESALESALHFTLEIDARGAAFVALAEKAFQHLVSYVDGLWEFSGTPAAAVVPFIASLDAPGPSDTLVRAAVAYRARLQDAPPGAVGRRHMYRIFFSVVAEFYATFAALGPALTAGYAALKRRMLKLLATTRAPRFARRSATFGLILCMMYPAEVSADLKRRRFPRTLGAQRLALHLPPGV